MKNIYERIIGVLLIVCLVLGVAIGVKTCDEGTDAPGNVAVLGWNASPVIWVAADDSSAEAKRYAKLYM